MFQQFMIYLVVTILMTPLLLFYGTPFLIVARLLYRRAGGVLGDGKRLMLACAIAALGIAPAYDVYRAPRPIYTWWIQGDPVGPGFTVASLFVTWCVLWSTMQLLQKVRQSRANKKGGAQ